MKFSQYSYLLILLLLVQVVQADDSFSGKQMFATHCSRCHKPGRILIGPDIKNIRDKRPEEWLLGFVKNSSAFINKNDSVAVYLYKLYLQTEMPPADLTDEQILTVFDYVDNYIPTSLKSTNKFVNKSHNIPGSKRYFLRAVIISALWVLLPLLLWIIIYFFKKKKFHIPHLLIIYLLVAVAISFFTLLKRYKDIKQDLHIAQREQPLAFSHKQHFETYDIDCIYCHIRAVKDGKANLPGVALCMKCHDYITEGEETGKEVLAKLTQMSDKGKNITWQTGYRPPPYVHFNHYLHTSVASIDCLDCHPLNPEPSIMAYTFTMGVCIECHQQQTLNSNNHYYSFLQDSNLINSKAKEWGTDCSLCHY